MVQFFRAHSVGCIHIRTEGDTSRHSLIDSKFNPPLKSVAFAYINLLLTATACSDKSHVALSLHVQFNVHVHVLHNIVDDSQSSYNPATIFVFFCHSVETLTPRSQCLILLFCLI